MSLFPPVTRPNGKVYHPRKYRFDHGEGGPNGSLFWCLVLGTHDVPLAREIAERETRHALGEDVPLTVGITGWWRDGYEYGARTWVWDEITGAAGVMFTEDC